MNIILGHQVALLYTYCTSAIRSKTLDNYRLVFHVISSVECCVGSSGSVSRGCVALESDGEQDDCHGSLRNQGEMATGMLPAWTHSSMYVLMTRCHMSRIIT